VSPRNLQTPTSY